MNTDSPAVQLMDFTHRKRGSSAGHDYSVGILQTSGSAEFAIGERFTLRPGELYVIPAGAPHAFFGAREEGSRGWGFRLPGRFDHLRGRKPITRLADESVADLEAWLTRIQSEQLKPNTCSLAMTQALNQAVHIECARALGIGPCAQQPALVRRAIEVIQTDYATSLRPRDIAARIGVTASHLSHEFQRVTGRSPTEWIAQARLDAARAHLLSSRDSVSAIAEAVGYADVSQLNRQFRRRFGVSPRGWQQANANKARYPAK